MKHFIYIALLIFLAPLGLYAQSGKEKPFDITFNALLAGKAVVVESSQHIADREIVIENCKFYVTSLRLTKGGKVLWSEENSFHLIDITDSSSLRLSVKTPAAIDYDSLHFCIGIDSITNKNGIGSGVLDPTKGMYWSWQSGYINFKLEGRSPQSNARKQEFRFHLGGFSKETYCTQELSFASSGKDKMHIDFDLARIIEALDFKVQNHIMIPGKEAVLMAQGLKQMFYLNTKTQ